MSLKLLRDTYGTEVKLSKGYDDIKIYEFPTLE